LGLLEERDRVCGVLERWVLSRVCGVRGVDGGVVLGAERQEMGRLRFMGLAIEGNVADLSGRRCIQR